MTKDSIIKAIAYRLGNLRGQDAAIEIELDLTINRLEAGVFHPWFLLSSNNFYEGATPEWRVPLPADFLMEYEEGGLFIEGDYGWNLLDKVSQDDLIGMNMDVGFPRYYALTGNLFRLFPTPSQDFKVEMVYYKRSGGLSNDNNPWFVEAPELLIYETATIMMLARKNNMGQTFKSLADNEMRKLQSKHTERMVVNQDLVYGGRELWD